MNIRATRLARAAWLGCLLALLVLLPLAAFAQSVGSAIPSAEGGSRVMAVAAGLRHSCAVKANGSVACWGRTIEGQAPQTQDDANYGLLAGPYISIAAGDAHTCALRTDGDLVCWGKGAPHAGQTIAGPFVSVSASGYHIAALRADGSVAVWGDSPPQAVLAGPYVSVSAGSLHTCALKADGDLMCWGRGADAGPPIAGPFVSVSAGLHHTCALKADGRMVCWGAYSNWFDEAPQYPGEKNYELLAGPYVSIATGADATCGLKADGSAWCFGRGHMIAHAYRFPPTTASAGPFVSIAIGFYHTCLARANGSVACWGAGAHDDLYFYDVRQSRPPEELNGTVGVLGFGQIAAGNAHACQVRPDGTLGCWGQNNYGDGALFGAATPPGGGTFTSVVAGDSHSCALDTNSKVTCWGRNGMENTALPMIANERFRQLAPGPDGAICALSISTSLDFCARRTVGYVHTNLQFQNITHTKDIAGSPELCGVSLSHFGYGYCNSGFIVGHWQRLESGLNHQCGLRDNGTIECWGDNAFGQINAASGTFRAFSVGWNHACAIRGNGTLACWGSNVDGQTESPSGAFVQVSAGNTFTCAIRDNGTRTCWGSDAQGQAPRLVLSPGTLPSGVTGSAYAGAQFSVADGTGPYVPVAPTGYALVAGALPSGLSLSAAGVLSGTPTAAGTHTFSVEAKDGNGFTASREYSITVADDTGPVINYTLTSVPPGNNGWYRGDVTIEWSVVDVDSAITSRTGCSPITLNSDTAGATFTCTAASAGGTSSMTTTTLKRDATAPTFTPSVHAPLLRGHSYHASPNASDATSGIANASCDPLDTSTLGTKSTTCSASDNAGNSKTLPLSYTVTTTCVNDGYSGNQLTWCRNICEMGYTGDTLNKWLHRWTEHYHNLPYCRLEMP
ncbi:putative Ig domain-containing protein [Rudaea cellulosilytica]|uniref:putative Ig domain-containing protein n=1 Tax=Rudaea cellulosilytica TaxID=540746 RepID=UPI00146C533A|nr:putative Ig domain-containing protein [Rudaea cellulosilytica]